MRHVNVPIANADSTQNYAQRVPWFNVLEFRRVELSFGVTAITLVNFSSDAFYSRNGFVKFLGQSFFHSITIHYPRRLFSRRAGILCLFSASRVATKSGHSHENTYQVRGPGGAAQIRSGSDLLLPAIFYTPLVNDTHQRNEVEKYHRDKNRRSIEIGQVIFAS